MEGVRTRTTSAGQKQQLVDVREGALALMHRMLHGLVAATLPAPSP